MKREILMNVMGVEKRAAIIEDGRLVELYIERAFNERVAGNIYKGRVENVLPGMQAAFVNVGLERNAFLYVDDALASLDFPDIDGEIGDDVEDDRDQEKERATRRRLTISDLLTVGQDIVVQITKEPIGTKGARVVTNLTIPGRYLVLMPTVSYAGVSRRIEDQAERDRLRQIASKAKPASMGVIVRTAAEGRSEKEIQRDIKFLLKVWERLQHKASRAKAPAILYKDYDLVYRLVRDTLTEEVDRFVLDSKAEFDRARDLLSSLAPKLRKRVELCESKTPLFESYDLETQIEKALKRKVWLDCGGYLVIDETEALISIDVNTGKFTGTTNLADTVLKTNLEAAVEIARQLRLRNMAGIIIADFIDMDSAEHQNKVLRTLEEEVKKDKTKTNIVGLTQLGLVEITRKKVKQDLDQVLLKRCPYCDGIGRVLSEETVAINVERQLHLLADDPAIEAVLVLAHPSVAALLIGAGGANLRRLEEETGKVVFVRGALHQHITDVSIVSGSKDEVERRALPVRAGQVLEIVVEEPHITNPKDGIARIEGYVLNIEGAGTLVGQMVRVEISRVFRTYAKAKLDGVVAGAGPTEGAAALGVQAVRQPVLRPDERPERRTETTVCPPEPAVTRVAEPPKNSHEEAPPAPPETPSTKTDRPPAGRRGRRRRGKSSGGAGTPAATVNGVPNVETPAAPAPKSSSRGGRGRGRGRARRATDQGRGQATPASAEVATGVAISSPAPPDVLAVPIAPPAIQAAAEQTAAAVAVGETGAPAKPRARRRRRRSRGGTRQPAAALVDMP